MKTMRLKRSLVESLLFIVMTFVECLWVQCTVFSYKKDNAQHFRQKKVYFDLIGKCSSLHTVKPVCDGPEAVTGQLPKIRGTQRRFPSKYVENTF